MAAQVKGGEWVITEGEKDESRWYPAWCLDDGWMEATNCLFLTSTRLLARQLGEVSGFVHAPLILVVMASVAMETSSRYVVHRFVLSLCLCHPPMSPWRRGCLGT